MLIRRFVKSVVISVCTLVLAAGVAVAPVTSAFAEDATESTTVPTATETPAPTDTPTPTDAPVPTEEPQPAPSATETPIPTETPAPIEEPDVPAAPSEPVPPAPEIAPVPLETFAAAAGFQAGNIISDYNFYNSWAMTEAEIQAFLVAQVGACGNSNCLAVYRTNTPTKTFSYGTCATYQGAAGESAARIIFKVQQACGISAKVILVTLQKEQGLITSSAPSEGVMRKAMGYGCPDTSDCDANFYGFFNQIYAAGRQLTWYNNPEGSFTKRFAVGQWNSIQYDPNTACGASNVFVSNKATAALYYYTPYQPNQNALDAGWGSSSDPCASYGNRNFHNFYSSWFGDPRAGGSPAAERIAGDDRFTTSVAVSKRTYPSAGVPVAFVTTGVQFPDALSAAPAAAFQGGPLLLTAPDVVPAAVTAELNRLKPGKIVVVGGEDAVSAAVATSLGSIAPVTRVAGQDRFDTSRKVAAFAFSGATGAYIATGSTFPDALSAGAAAGSAGYPVLLVPGEATSVDAPTRAQLAGKTSVFIAGGTAAVSAGLERSLAASGRTVTRYAGYDRNDTSYLINMAAFPTAKTAYLATGWSFPDALAGAAAAAKTKTPLFVVPAYCVPAQTRAALTSTLKVNKLLLLGGSSALFDSVAGLAVC